MHHRFYVRHYPDCFHPLRKTAFARLASAIRRCNHSPGVRRHAAIAALQDLLMAAAHYRRAVTGALHWSGCRDLLFHYRITGPGAGSDSTRVELLTPADWAAVAVFRTSDPLFGPDFDAVIRLRRKLVTLPRDGIGRHVPPFASDRWLGAVRASRSDGGVLQNHSRATHRLHITPLRIIELHDTRC